MKKWSFFDRATRETWFTTVGKIGIYRLSVWKGAPVSGCEQIRSKRCCRVSLHHGCLRIVCSCQRRSISGIMSNKVSALIVLSSIATSRFTFPIAGTQSTGFLSFVLIAARILTSRPVKALVSLTSTSKLLTFLAKLRKEHHDNGA